MRSFRMNVTWRGLTGSGWKGWRRPVADRPPLSAGELYTGQHWSRAAAAAARNGAEMWVISAGLGFLPTTDCSHYPASWGSPAIVARYASQEY